MSDDIRSTLAKPNGALKFAAPFIDGYLSPAFGARSKSEIDLLVFSCLIEAKAIDPETPIYDIARALNVTPSRARGLLLNWQLRLTPATADLRSAIVDALKKTHFSKDGTLLAFGVESPLLKEDIVARLKRKGIFPDAAFAKELVKLPVDVFVEFLDDVLDPATKKDVRTALVRDKQLPDTSFKALAKGVLMKLGEKVADEAGKEFAQEITGKVGSAAVKPAIEKVAGFLSGLLAGDAKAATKNISKDDFIDV